jgi:hypothetical protein
MLLVSTLAEEKAAERGEASERHRGLSRRRPQGLRWRRAERAGMPCDKRVESAKDFLCN